MSARADPRGGRLAMVVPTATSLNTWRYHRLISSLTSLLLSHPLSAHSVVERLAAVGESQRYTCPCNFEGEPCVSLGFE
jgi:hypothetical protein